MIKKINIDDNYRVIVISDIHGAHKPLRDIIGEVKLRDEDYLFIIGDFLEKGIEISETLEYVIELSLRKNTIVLKGNNEDFVLKCLFKDSFKDILIKYICKKTYPSIFDTWLDELGVDITKVEGEYLQELFLKNYKKEIDFIDSLPLAIDMDEYIFVHAGINPDKPLDETKAEEFLYMDNFYQKYHSLDKYVVVGHWPCSNYTEDRLSNAILFNHDKRIIAIDGGYGVKTTGQINALTITKTTGQVDYREYYSDYFDRYRVIEGLEGKEGNCKKVGWPNNKVELLEQRSDFSLCFVPAHNTTCYIKNEIIRLDGEQLYLSEDFSHKFLRCRKNSIVSLVSTYGRYALVRFDNEFSWVEKRVLVKI